MAIEIACPNCRSKLRIADDVAGKQVRCPACSAVFTAPDSGPPASPVPPEASDSNPFQPSNVAAETAFAGANFPSGMPQMTPRAIEALVSSRPWVLLIAILSFLGGGLYVLIGLANVVIGLAGGGPQAMQIIPGVVCLVFSVPMIFLGWFQLQFGRGIGRFMRLYDSGSLEDAMVAQRSYWLLLGILALLGIAFGVVACAAGAVMPFLLRH